MAANSVFYGGAFAYVNIELTLNNQLVAGIKGINYKDNLNRQAVYGTASQPIDMTRGRYSADGSIEFYKRAFLLAFLANLGPAWRQTQFPISVSYGPNSDGLIQTDLIPVALAGELSSDNSESDGEPLSNKINLYIPQQILWNGVPSFIETVAQIAIA